MLNHADSVINELLPYFSFDAFKERFNKENSFQITHDRSSLNFASEFVRKKYIKNGNIAMDIAIKNSVDSILRFTKTDNIPMRSITPDFCQRYEDYMYNKSKTKTRNGAGINMRHLRIIFNQAISARLIPRSWYPFKRESGEVSEFEDPYVIPSEQKVKTYLKEDEFVRFSDVNKFLSPVHEAGYAAFLISFYCNGSNAADFLRFKFRDIHGEFIVFYREKIKKRIQGKPETD